MKKIFLAAAALFFANAVSAQAWNGKGDQKAQAGVNAWGYGTGIAAAYDYGLTDMISVGAGAHAYFDNYRHNDKDNRVFVFGRVNVHLQDPLQLADRLDIYPGLDIGVVGRDFGLGAHIGVRYFFTDKIGAFAEVGNNGNFGVVINL